MKNEERIFEIDDYSDGTDWYAEADSLLFDWALPPRSVTTLNTSIRAQWVTKATNAASRYVIESFSGDVRMLPNKFLSVGNCSVSRSGGPTWNSSFRIKLDVSSARIEIGYHTVSFLVDNIFNDNRVDLDYSPADGSFVFSVISAIKIPGWHLRMEPGSFFSVLK